MAVEMKTLYEAEAVRGSVGSTPDPEVAALPKRRRFSATYKRGIVRAAAACKESGEIGALPRRARKVSHVMLTQGAWCRYEYGS